MAVLVVNSQDVLDDIACTPDIEGGIGPVLIGKPLVGADGRLAVCHPWNQITVDWLEAYTANMPGVQVLEKLPENWQYQS